MEEIINKPSFWKKLTIVLISLSVILIFGYLYSNFDALWQKNTSPSSNQAFAIIPSDSTKINQNLYRLIFLDTVGNYPGTGPKKTQESKAPEPAPTNNPIENNSDQSSSSQQNYSINLDNYLFIPNLNIKVPIVWDSPLDNATMLDNLRYGVIHYLGTAKPGEKAPDGSGEGNIFIAGHSSYYRSDPGKYKTVFANLDRLEGGDQIAINYNGKIYVYNVVDKVVVMPEDVNVLSQNTAKSILSLMTCVPVGTNEKRLIIKAEFAGFAE